MKKALIITYYWPPAGGSGVQRWLKFVKYFREFGIEPIIYTVDNPDYPITDDSLIADVPKGVEVIKQPILEPNNIGALFGKKKKESAGFLNPNPGFVGKILQYVRANFFIPDARKFWIKPSVKYLKKYLKTNNVDILISTGPPHSLHLIALQLKKELEIKWIADFRDPWTEIDYFHQLPLTKSSIKKHTKLEQKVLKNADAVLVVGDNMKSKYDPFNSNVVTVTNGFDGIINSVEKNLDAKFSITHIGLMNADRNPKMLWEVLQDICNNNADFKNDFVLKLIGKVDESVKQEISNFQLQDNIELVSYVPHNEVIQYQKKSQVLLLLVNNVPSAKGIITGKIFEYLMAKRPILAIAPEDGDLASILNETNAGSVIGFENKESLKKNIINLYLQYKRGELEIKSQNIEQYHRKQLTSKVAEIINRVVK